MVPPSKALLHVPVGEPAAIAQLIPLGVDATLPRPEPAPVTVRTAVAVAKLATMAVVTAGWTGIENWHVPVPEHPAPDQPTNVLPGDGVGLSVTELGFSKVYV